MRKKAPGNLGKRLRKLVKSWQSLVKSTPSNNVSPASGYSPALNARECSPASVSTPIPSLSPHIPYNKSASPVLPVRTRLSSPAICENTYRPHRLVSPLVRPAGGHQSPANVRRISPSHHKPSTPRTAPNAPLAALSKTTSSRPGTPNGTKSSLDNGRNHTPVSTNSNNHLTATPHLFDGTSRTHAGNKKRRRSDESNASDSSSIKKARTLVNGAVERIKPAKVKTTAEIIKDLQSSRGKPLAASDTITKIVTNQIEKEEDDIRASVVPVSAMPRSRRKNGPVLPDPQSTKAEISKTKSDMVHRFLQQTVQLGNSGDEAIAPSFGDVSSGPLDYTETIDMSVDPYSLLPAIDYDNLSWGDEYSDDGIVHRNAITGEYPDGCEPGEGSNSGNSPTQIHTERDICENWNGVNGTTNDANSQFHPWTETFTINPSEEQLENVHVMLPYVDL